MALFILAWNMDSSVSVTMSSTVLGLLRQGVQWLVRGIVLQFAVAAQG
jgi:hypothetical protein